MHRAKEEDFLADKNNSSEGNILAEIRRDGFSFARLAERCPELSRLKGIPQNPDYHAEGDVYRHTEMVCGELTKLDGWSRLKGEEQELLFLSAAFHDIGKAFCTRKEDGQWVSPKHTGVGEREFRRLVYLEAEHFGLSFEQRELAAQLIRHHGLPVWFWTKKRPEYDLLKAAESVPLRLLYLLSMADITGRENRAGEDMSERVELFADFAEELGIWEGPFPFANRYTRFRYFHGSDLPPEANLYDDTGFDVILMSGLPLSGKDSWIAEYGREAADSGLPAISMDDIREQLGIPPAKKSDQIARMAADQAKIYLRQKRPFIWNATNIVRETRQRLIGLFAGYGARVHIRYLEAPYRELLARNRKRARSIPPEVLEKMIQKLEPPALWEAYEVRRPG